MHPHVSASTMHKTQGISRCAVAAFQGKGILCVKLFPLSDDERRVVACQSSRNSMVLGDLSVKLSASPSHRPLSLLIRVDQLGRPLLPMQGVPSVEACPT